jgi:hypothetical protein
MRPPIPEGIVALTFFQVVRSHYRTTCKIAVDARTREAEYTVVYDGRIIQTGNISALAAHFDDVATPERAEAYIAARIEGMDFSARLISKLEARS